MSTNNNNTTVIYTTQCMFTTTSLSPCFVLCVCCAFPCGSCFCCVPGSRANLHQNSLALSRIAIHDIIPSSFIHSFSVSIAVIICHPCCTRTFCHIHRHNPRIYAAINQSINQSCRPTFNHSYHS
jgi:hypothetical protein